MLSFADGTSREREAAKESVGTIYYAKVFLWTLGQDRLTRLGSFRRLCVCVGHFELDIQCDELTFDGSILSF